MRLACIDTNILSWALLDTSGNGHGDEPLRARQLFKRLESQKVHILLPAVVVGELLVCVAPERRNATRAALEQRFIIEPYDALAAWEAARIRSLNHDELEKMKNASDSSSHYPRCRITPDHQIIAIALVRKADALYTEDQRLAKLARAHIQTLGLPPVAMEQMPIPARE